MGPDIISRGRVSEVMIMITVKLIADGDVSIGEDGT
jgi:hypothetical protein